MLLPLRVLMQLSASSMYACACATRLSPRSTVSVAAVLAAARAAAGLLRLHEGRGHVGHRHHHGRAHGRQSPVPRRHRDRPAVHNSAVPGAADELANGVFPAQPPLCGPPLPGDAPLADGASEVRGAAGQGSSTLHAGPAVHGPSQAADGARVPGAPVVCGAEGGVRTDRPARLPAQQSRPRLVPGGRTAACSPQPDAS